MRQNLHWVASIVLLLLFPAALLAQMRANISVPDPTVPKILERMGHTVVLDNHPPKGSHHFRISWQSSTMMGVSSTVQMQFLERIDRKEPPPRQRSTEVSKDHLVVVFLDQQGTVRYWRAIIDPRLARAEFPDADGNLRKYSFYRADVILDVSVPDTLEAAEMHILSPSWESTGALQLSPVFAGKLPLKSHR